MSSGRTDPRNVVVTGMGVTSAIGMGLSAFTEGLRSGKNGISEIEAFDTTGFRSRHAGEIKEAVPPPRDSDRPERKPVDRASRLALLAAYEACRMSGLSSGEHDRERIGIALGSCSGGYLGGLEYYAARVRDQKYRASRLLDLPLHSAASRIAREFQFLGPLSLLSNACASSAVAIAYATAQIQAGSASVMLAGGYDALTPLNCAGFGSMRNSSPSNRLRPFDAGRDGTLLGEGSAILVLEKRDRCLARGATILAELAGCGITSDTYHMTAPDPSGSGAAEAMRLALVSAGLSTSDIDYLNAHGTGTQFNDVMETNAVKRLFGDRARSVPMSSTKSMIGHTLGAAGAVEVVASIAAMNGGFLPPTINFETPDRRCDLDYVPNLSRPAPIRAFLSNSFGFGGTNCSLLVARAGDGSPPQQSSR